MELSPKLKIVAPHYAAAKETFIRLDSEIEKLLNASNNQVVSHQEMCIKNILQALLVQIPAVSHDIRRLAINGRNYIDNQERQDAIKLALANVERLRKAQEQPVVREPLITAKPEPIVTKNETVAELEPKPKKKTVRKKIVAEKDK